MHLAAEQRARHRQREGIAAVADAGRQQIGAELRRDRAGKHLSRLPQHHHAVAQRLPMRGDPTADALVRDLVEMPAERGLRGVRQGFPGGRGQRFEAERGPGHRRAGVGAAQLDDVLALRQQPRPQPDAERMPAVADARMHQPRPVVVRDGRREGRVALGQFEPDARLRGRGIPGPTLDAARGRGVDEALEDATVGGRSRLNRRFGNHDTSHLSQRALRHRDCINHEVALGHHRTPISRARRATAIRSSTARFKIFPDERSRRTMAGLDCHEGGAGTRSVPRCKTAHHSDHLRITYTGPGSLSSAAVHSDPARRRRPSRVSIRAGPPLTAPSAGVPSGVRPAPPFRRSA